MSYSGTVRTWAEEINSKASYRNILNTQRWQNWKINQWSESSKRCIFQPCCPQGWGISQADVSSHRTSWTHYRQPRHPQLPVYTVHSQISPVREFNAAITFFSVATTNFLDPGENSKEANLSFPTYCCLLKEGGQKMEGANVITAQDTLEKRQLHKYRKLSPSHLSWDAQEMFVNEEIWPKARFPGNVLRNKGKKRREYTLMPNVTLFLLNASTYLPYPKGHLA